MGCPTVGSGRSTVDSPWPSSSAGRQACREVVDTVAESELYTFEAEVPELDQPILLYGLSGFIDAGRAVRRARLQMFDDLDHEVLVSFDVDQLIDYRSWRPQIAFERDHYTDYRAPRIELYLVRDADGVPFLFLTGREPDLQWERFATSIEGLVRTFGVGLCVELHAIPMSVPHTRPTAFTAHGNRSDLVDEVPSHKHSALVPASIGALLEYRLGQAQHDTFGLAVHVPHYLAEGEYPAAAAALLDRVAAATGLTIPTANLHELAAEAHKHIDEQMTTSDELAQAVHELEEQYDAWVQSSDLANALTHDLPTADELGQQFERYLAEHDGRDDL